MPALTKDDLERFRHDINVGFMARLKSEPVKQALANALAEWLEITPGINRRDLLDAARHASARHLDEREVGAIVADVWKEVVHKPGGRRTKGRRIFWRYAPVPLAVIDDTRLSHKAQRIAAVLARSVNMGAWNLDLHVDMSYAELGRRASMSRRGAMRAIAELWKYVEVSSLGRGGCRFTFRAKPLEEIEI